ncbi:MAG: hypothetical protein WCH99_04090 [Verrucomicrobiota bacterium]
MRIEEIKPLIDLAAKLIPVESEDKIKKIMAASQDKVGEFWANLRPSDCLMLIKTHRDFKARIEAAQLEGKNEI